MEIQQSTSFFLSGFTLFKNLHLHYYSQFLLIMKEYNPTFTFLNSTTIMGYYVVQNISPGSP